ncbi:MULTISPECIES: LytR family transcriptional regulator [Metabacillus]|uniref:LytR family transcriptional regulator n=2 Tax=Metabacillus TaxID=2675233 RepID=A0A179T388_9BACI|nr:MULTISPECIES: LytR family transcriptional regulator [Metabacillus]OAS88171.1 LytR family transcriptional regulator [Metabacillus litoralis]QNF27399.1 LytR family transcriptional regulator [Metabacillus sp. KUDC1714]
MKNFDKLPKSIKKTLRYINQDVNSVDKLEQIEKTVNLYIQKRKQQLKDDSSA